ncbi:MAG: hypothetical protein JWQ07_2151 [Ramlibacter sp.]|nr:hypothetical protein [Ramlibacter sp.]
MSGKPPVWLFVAYGGGHIRMLLPVARLARERGLAEPVILALTTAAAAARQEGFEPVGFADFVEPGDDQALEKGRQLAAGLASIPVDGRETAAYLGLSYADLEARYGPPEAKRRYEQEGRQCFEPQGVLERIIGRMKPALVVATNSPRAEKAAILAAHARGVPSACIVDLFAVDEVAWIGRDGYADRVCVLNEAVRARLVAAGRRPEEIVVTGNPAFDALRDPDMATSGQELRETQGWGGRNVVVWASQPEPATHPSVPGRTGNPALPGQIQQELLQWAAAANDRLLVVRRHPSEAEPVPLPVPNVRWDGRQFELHQLLHACDALVTMNSTVGVEAYIAGRPVVQVLGSLFDESVPLARFGMATACHSPGELAGVLDGCLAAGAATREEHAQTDRESKGAAKAVLAVLKEL